ncbi:Small nuclear ribonucleoprotein 200 (U5) [Entamoeba marina]
MAHIVNHYPDLPSGSEGKRRAIDGEPTGEPESLFGKISKEMMGDKAQRTDPKEIVKNMKDYRKDIDDDDNDNASYVPKRIPKIYDTEIVEGYVPTNKTTKELHATLLSHVQRLFSDKPYQFIRSATLDVLDIIKGEGTATEKWTKLKKEVNNNINEDLFTDMLQIAEQLTDYAQEKETKDIDENNMEDQEIPILIEEDEENIGFEPEIAEDEDSAEVKEEVVLMEEDSVEENLGDVDAYWLQRQIHSVVSDEHIAQDLASKQHFLLLKTRRTEQTSETQQKDHDDRKTRMLDLNLLTFGSGSHFMSNQKATFPQNTIRTDLADYTQVDIPMETNIPVSSNLIAINTLPKWAQESLNPLKYLNRIQSAVFPTVFNTNENCLVCAPTGAGKTTVALLSILRAYQNAVENNEKFKAIYIAPMKSLVQEMVGTLQGKLDNLGLKVAEMSGDASLGKKTIRYD